MDDLVFQVVEVVVIKVKASLEGTIGYPTLAFQQVNDLGEHLIEGHSRPFHCLDFPSLLAPKMTHFRPEGKRGLYSSPPWHLPGITGIGCMP